MKFPAKIVKTFGKNGQRQRPNYKGEKAFLKIWIPKELEALARKSDALVFDIFIEPELPVPKIEFETADKIRREP